MKLPALFADGMVLQRDLPIAVWGWAEPGEGISVSLAGHTVATETGADGRFKVFLPPLPAGGPHVLTVSGRSAMTFDDVWIGEVWLASGQSNMEWPLNSACDAAAEIQAANDPLLRHCFIPRTTALTPAADVSASWQPASPDTAGGFSAVAYFFARVLRQKLNVPVGVINASWGGTLAEAWTSRGGLAAEPALKCHVDNLDRLQGDDSAKLLAECEAARQAWLKTLPQDTHNRGFAEGWAKPEHDDRAWEFMDQPIYWAQTGKLVHGICWFRREVEVPAHWTGQDLSLRLGAVDKSDQTYFNGVQVGSLTWEENEESWAMERRYTIPARLVRPGRNVISVRVMSVFTGGGIAGPLLQLVAPGLAGEKPLLLNGPWRYRIEKDLGTVQSTPRPVRPSGNNVPASLFNGMIAPLIPYTLRGAIWYQGESNVGRTAEYRTLFPALIRDWRRHWGLGDFPFYFVQLANFQHAIHPEFVNSRWAELREAQTAALALPNTGMAVTIDIGEPKDIHPHNKQDVGLRLALNALARTYGQEVECCGPRYRALRRDGSKLVLTFDHAAGLCSRGGPPERFGIAGADGVFHKAEAVIRGLTVELSCAAVPAPVAACYGWGDSPVCNLYNGAGLPMEPFRLQEGLIRKGAHLEML
jgi:sialate O-acetylesterase